MPLILRNVRQNRWFKEQATAQLANGDVPADPLADLATTNNTLSVWEVADDRSNVERIVRAVAVTKNELADAGYVLFDSQYLEVVGIQTQKERGKTPDDDANAWHLDLVDLSGNKLVMLTRLILENGESGRVLRKRLEELVSEGIQSKQLPERCGKKLTK